MEHFEIAGLSVPPGTRARVGMPVARLSTDQQIEVPLIIMHGAYEGPIVFVTAAIHGDEVGGTEIVRRVVDAIDPSTLRGTLLAIPVVNEFGFVQNSRYLPDRRDLNRCFPGSLRGSLASQIAHLLMTEVVRRCSFGIDLHGGSDHRTNLPQVRGDLDDPQIVAMSEAFGAPLALHATLRRGSLRHAASRAGIPCLLYEAGEPLRFDASALEVGTGGVLRVLQHLNMLENAPPAPGPVQYARRSRWMRASRAGIVQLVVSLGHSVRPKQIVAVIRNIYGDTVGTLRAQRGGTVIAHSRNPIVNRGDAVLHLAEEAGIESE